MENTTQSNVRDNVHDSEMIDFDLKRLLPAILNRIWLIGIFSILCGMFALGGTIMFATPQYKASAMLYVNNNVSVGGTSVSISSGDITTSKTLVSSYIVILKTRSTLLDVIDYAGLDISYGELKSMISAGAVNKTEIFQVTVVSDDPKEAEVIANAIAHIVPNKISSIIEGSSAKIVDYAVVPGSPFSPDYSRNTILGLLAGLIFSVCFVVVAELLDVAIRDEDDLRSFCSYPILASVPDMAASVKHGYYRRYYKRGYYARGNGYYNTDNKENKDTNDTEEKNTTKKKWFQGYKGNVEEETGNFIGVDIGFAASEAYKLLRTKIQYSFVDDQKCHTFSVTSALAGEGKSLTGINLACSLAQLNKRILVIDCDMRRPTLAEKLSQEQCPGLSEFLTGHIEMSDIVRTFDLGEGNNPIYVVTAGNTPPNPVELLSSEKMKSLLGALREDFDYILLDMPPVCDVSDPLVSAQLTDGVLMVVRQDYGSRTAVQDALRQLEFVNVKLLGILFNFATDRNVSYKRTRYGYRYGYRYGRRSHHYGYRHAQSHYYRSYYSTDSKNKKTGKNAKKADK